MNHCNFKILFLQIICSGYLELHIQSPHIQTAIVNISSNFRTEKSKIVHLKLKSNVPFNVTRIPVNFDNIYNITIKCGKSEEDGKFNSYFKNSTPKYLGLTDTTIVSTVHPRVGLLSPAAVARPLNGIRIVIGCNK